MTASPLAVHRLFSYHTHSGETAFVAARRLARRSRRCTLSRPLLEFLEQRIFLSAVFTYDLRLAPGQLGASADGYSVDLSSPHASTYTLQLFGQLTGNDTNLNNDLFCYGAVSLASNQLGGYGALAGGGIVSGRLNAGLGLAYQANGSAADISRDGVSDWGTARIGDPEHSVFWFFADSYSFGMGYLDGSVVPGVAGPSSADPDHTWEILLATFTVDASALSAGDMHDRTTLFNVTYVPDSPAFDTFAVGFRADGDVNPLHDLQIGPGVAFHLGTTPNRTVFDVSKSLTAGTAASFAASDFADAFTDGPYGGELQSIRITSLPEHGSLTLDGQPVALNEDIALNDLAALSYQADSGYSGADGFAWNAFDGTAFASADARVTFDIAAAPLPPAPVPPPPAPTPPPAQSPPSAAPSPPSAPPENVPPPASASPPETSAPPQTPGDTPAPPVGIPPSGDVPPAPPARDPLSTVPPSEPAPPTDTVPPPAAITDPVPPPTGAPVIPPDDHAPIDPGPIGILPPPDFHIEPWWPGTQLPGGIWGIALPIVMITFNGELEQQAIFARGLSAFSGSPVSGIVAPAILSRLSFQSPVAATIQTIETDAPSTSLDVAGAKTTVLAGPWGAVAPRSSQSPAIPAGTVDRETQEDRSIPAEIDTHLPGETLADGLLGSGLGTQTHSR